MAVPIIGSVGITFRLNPITFRTAGASGRGKANKVLLKLYFGLGVAPGAVEWPFM